MESQAILSVRWLFHVIDQSFLWALVEKYAQLRGAGLDSDGTGSLTLIAEGDLPQLGLGPSD